MMLRFFTPLFALTLLTACGEEAEAPADSAVTPSTDAATAAVSNAEDAATTPASAEGATTSEAQTDTAGANGVRGPVIIGDPNAPVIIEEYASLTCPACGQFHRYVYPELKEKLIDTGKVQFHFYNYILGGRVDLAASSIARCTTQPVAANLISTLFQRQAEWARSQDVVGELAAIARGYGISRVQFDTCLQNTDMHRHLIDMTKAAGERGVTATPTIYVAGTKLDNYSPETIIKAVEAAK